MWSLYSSYSKRVTPEARCPEKMGKTPTYYLYHKMLRHPTKNYYIFKDVLQALIDREVLKLHLEQKKVIANMIATSPLQLGRDLPPTLNGVVPISRGKLRVINIDPYNQKEKALVPVPTSRGETIWVYPNIVESNSGQLSYTGSFKVRLEHLIVM